MRIRLLKYDCTLLLNESKDLTRCVSPSSLNNGTTPFEKSYVYSPNRALYSVANLEVPQPLSFAACAKTIEFGITSTNSNNSFTTSSLCLPFDLNLYFFEILFINLSHLN